MPRKKKEPGDKPEDKGKDKQSIHQDAQSQTISSSELEKALQIALQQLGSQTSGSKSQTGSSTQQAGSSTHQIKQESSTPTGPSAQKPSKKTLADYAQAYANKTLPSNTYKQVVSDKAQNMAIVPEYYLSKAEALTKAEFDRLNKQPEVLVINPKPRQKQLTIADSSSKAIVVSQNQTQMTTPYFVKENCIRNVVQIEPEFYHSNPNQVALNYFPPGFHFKTTNLEKTREYYELILVHSGSISLTRNQDPRDQTVLTHSTLQILKVLTPSQWGPSLHKPRFFSNDGIVYNPDGYTYWDYVDAWSNVFLDQNKTFSHTWFVYFKIRTEYNFPQWFVHWWRIYGPVPEILPPKAIQALELFKQKFNNSEDPFPIDLHYFSKLSVSWIFSWKYRFSQVTPGSTLLPTLQQVPQVRWWAKFDIRRCDINKVEGWFKANPQYLCQTEQSKFLNQRSRIQTMLASTSDKVSLVN